MFVKLENVSKSFKNQEVLRNINLRIDSNQIFGLIGPSGSGKTTLIRLILGAEGIDSGAISVGHHTVPNLHILEKIGYMPQNDALYSELSGRENLFFFGGMYNIAGKESKVRTEEVLSLVNLENDGDKRVCNYSGGMKKRLSLAVALLHRPQLLILDEPTVGIDPVLREKIWRNFFELKNQGKTIIITTHVMEEAMKCDRLGLIYEGNIIACDTVKNLLHRTRNNALEEFFFDRGGRFK